MTDTTLTTTALQPPAPQVWPTLRAHDARALIAWLVQALGFEETAVFGDGEHVAHAQLSWPAGGGIMLGSARADGDDPWALDPGTAGCYVVAAEPAEVEALFTRATAAGAEVLRPVQEQDYGSREFSVRDPEGNRWSVGSYRGEPRSTS